MDPFVKSAVDETVERVEKRLRSQPIEPQDPLGWQQATPLKVEQLIREEFRDLAERYLSVDFDSAAVKQLVVANPSLLQVQYEDFYDPDLRAGAPAGSSDLSAPRLGLAADLDRRFPFTRVRRRPGGNWTDRLRSGDVDWSSLCSDPDVALYVAEDFGVRLDPLTQTIKPVDMIPSLVNGRLRVAAQVVLRRDFGPVISELNATLEQRYESASSEAASLEHLTPEWQSLVKESGQLPALAPVDSLPAGHDGPGATEHDSHDL